MNNLKTYIENNLQKVFGTLGAVLGFLIGLVISKTANQGFIEVPEDVEETEK